MAGTFVAAPPTVEPETLTVKVPCKGTDKDAVTIKISNPSNDRVVWKVTGTQMAKFTTTATTGFVDAKSSFNLEMVPKKMKKSDGFSKFDHFVIHCGAAPKGDMWKSDDIWASANTAPKSPKTYKVNLKVSDGKDEEEPE